MKKEKKKGRRAFRIIKGTTLTVLVTIALLAIITSTGIIPLFTCGIGMAGKTDSSDWMKNIDDERLLSEISLPGVHDAAAKNLPLDLLAKCQKYTVKDQLNSGYRYLDIRAGVDEIDGSNQLTLYHGFIPCYSGSGLIRHKYMLEELISDCYEFLEANPSETLVFVVKYEHGDASVEEFQELLDELIKKRDMWLLTDETPSIGEARGKLVLYRRYDDEAGLGERAGIALKWDDDKSRASDMSAASESLNNGAGYVVQDRFKLDPSDKWQLFTDTLSKTAEYKANNELPVINFLSTNGSIQYGTPCIYASDLNRRFKKFSFEDKQYTGWVILDYADEKMAKQIYETNY